MPEALRSFKASEGQQPNCWAISLVLKSPYLSNFFGMRSKDMDHLAGIGPEKVRIYAGPHAQSVEDEVDYLLSLASANLEVRLSQLSKCTDAATASPIGHLIRGKMQREFNIEPLSEKFITLREISGIPNVAEGVLEKKIDLLKIIRLRSSKSAEEFRKWFHLNCTNDVKTTAKNYCELLRQEPTVKSLPVRMLRFITTSAIGIISTKAGAVFGSMDSFVLEKILKDPSPKYFIDRLRQINK